MIDNVGQRVKPTHVYKGSVRRLWKALYVRAPPGPLHQPQDHRRSGDTSEQVQQKEPVAQDCEAKAMLRPPPAVLPWTWSWCDVCGAYHTLSAILAKLPLMRQHDVARCHPCEKTFQRLCVQPLLFRANFQDLPSECRGGVGICTWRTRVVMGESGVQGLGVPCTAALTVTVKATSTLR